ncbi:MAG: TolC family protein [Candidatus Dependentiae bacterium]|nr:TolC family protein [Candidatus Dependentiae bacterium]
MKKKYMPIKHTLILLLIFLPSCSTHKYKLPAIQIPEKFTHQEAAATDLHIAHWWQQFNDPLLNDLIMQAIENNYDLAIALEKIEEARAFYHIKKAELFPQIEALGVGQRIKTSDRLREISSTPDVTGIDRSLGIPGTTNSFFSIGFDTLWETDFWGRIWHDKNARYYTFQAEIEQMRAVRIILLADVARTYIQLCSLQLQIQYIQEKLDIDLKLVTLQEMLFTGGLINAIELSIQKQNADTTRSNLASLRIEYVQTKNKLAILTGKSPESLLLSPLPPQIPLSTATLHAGIPSDLLRQRPDIRQAERLLAAANESVSQAIAEWFPSFSLVGGFFSQASKKKNILNCGSMSWYVGPSVRWPLINFGRIQANIDTKKAVEKQAAFTYSQAVILALKDVEDFLIAYFQNQEQITLLIDKNNQAQVAETLAQDKYISGLENELEALRFRKNRIDTNIELIFIQESLSSNLISLYKALGGGW